jgi:hypothetical protein
MTIECVVDMEGAEGPAKLDLPMDSFPTNQRGTPLMPFIPQG